MNWIEFLIDKLELKNELKKKIIVDKYLFTQDSMFIDFLNEHNISFSIINNDVELLNSIQRHSNIFYKGDFKDIPSSVKNKREIFFLDENLCIAQIDKTILSDLDYEIIKNLIIYLIENKEKLYVNESNLEFFIKNAEKLYGKYEIAFLEKKIKNISKSLDVENILNIAKIYSKLNFISYEIEENLNDSTRNLVDNIMLDFILSDKYKNVFYAPDKTINNVLRIIKKSTAKKFALICFDGMGILEWNILKKFLIDDKINISKERFLFTLLPTTTLICRASLFSGKIEECYEKRLNETKEFKNFYNELKCESISHKDILNETFNSDAIKIIYNFFDDIAHGQSLPALDISKNIYLQTIENYLMNSTVVKEIRKLINLNYKIFITSDHGCVVSTGNGVNVDKYLIENKCKRAIITGDNKLVQKYKDDAIMFNPPFINNKRILLAKNRESFNHKNAIEITHGGATIEEMIIPFIEIN